jgi:hypothetical protein
MIWVLLGYFLRFFLNIEKVGLFLTNNKNLGVTTMNNFMSLCKVIVAIVICLYFTACEYGGRCIEGNCTNGQGALTLPGGEKYVGKFKDDKFNGQGTLTLPGGEKYVGKFKDDKFNGQGTLTLPDGIEYVGQFKDGKPNGLGTYRFPDGRIEHGIWNKEEIEKLVM